MKFYNNYFSVKKFFGVSDVKDNVEIGVDVVGNLENVCYVRIIV